MRRRNKILIVLFAGVTVVLATGCGIYSSLQGKITKRLEKGWVIPPLELYSQGFALSVGRQFPLASVTEELKRKNLSVERDYVLADVDACARLTGLEIKTGALHCLFLKNPALVVTWDEKGWIQQIWTGAPLATVNSFSLFPRLITQFFDGQPIWQQNTPLSEMPLACLQAVTAVEDREFLEHGGVSVVGTMRALLRNLRARRWAEGGSTITQQLVKNFFLSSKKTLRRKLEEQALAVMLEYQLSKDQILEMYLNVIYMGQSGPYQVRGFGSASQNYFDKPVTELNTSECAMLAAIINNPGRYSPFTHPDPARVRRDFVLHKMKEAQMLSDSELASAIQAPLPHLVEADRRSHAPYFVMSALREFTALGLEAEEGARLYTTLDPELQTVMTSAAQAELPRIEAKIKKPSAQPLQVAALTVDLSSGQILALIGGRDFKATQFNRAADSRRQIGSIVKPFVYWAGVKIHDPMQMVLDEPFEWKTGRQVWKPKDYDKESFGPVPYFFALAHSLNIPTARVGQEVGLDAVADALQHAGVTEHIPKLPSLTLGALELSPTDVAQAYFTLGRMGAGDHIHTLFRVEDLNGVVLYAHQPNPDLNLDPVQTAVLIGMMEQSINLGTARSARVLPGALAGKTGTTSDTKDAWFAGFSPRILTVVWVGYDDNTVMGLTGAGAALPIWTEINKTALGMFVAEDFKWPDGIRVKEFSRSELLEKFPTLTNLPDQVQLPFAR